MPHDSVSVQWTFQEAFAALHVRDWHRVALLVDSASLERFRASLTRAAQSGSTDDGTQANGVPTIADDVTRRLSPHAPSADYLALYLELSWPDDVVRSEEIIATRVLDGGRDAVVEYRVTSHAENRTGQFFAAIHLHFGAGEWRIVLNHDITGFGDSL